MPVTVEPEGVGSERRVTNNSVKSKCQNNWINFCTYMEEERNGRTADNANAMAILR